MVELNKIIEAEKNFTKKDWLELVILTRASSIYPFNLMSAFWAITNIDYKTYLIGTIIGILPSKILEIYIGSLSASLQDVHSNKNIVLLVISIIISIALTYFISIFVKKKISEKIN